MKQTSIEWLANELYEKFEMRGDGILFDEILNKAKELEKQQIIDAYETAMETDIYNVPLKVGEQYYTETFKTK